jgi:hypothetical protein
MGFNGKQQSHSIIGFELVKGNNSLDLNDIAYPCQYPVPTNGSLGNYTKVLNCSCTACDAACPAPPVDATIAFFAGFDGILVAIVYGSLIVFSIVFQLIRAKLMSKIDPADEQGNNEDANQPLNQPGNADESISRHNSRGRGPKENINDS